MKGEVNSGRDSSRERKPLGYLKDYIQGDDREKGDGSLTTVDDYSLRAGCDVPVTVKEYMTSPESGKCQKAMDREMKSLEDNRTFTLTKLPVGRKTVGGRRVHYTKESCDRQEQYKARFGDRGHSHRTEIDYGDNVFSGRVKLGRRQSGRRDIQPG